jgi:hypothetical protein
MMIFAENEVAAERPRRQRSCLTHHGPGVFGPRERYHSERAGIRYRRSQPGNGGHGRLDDRSFDPE